MVEDTKMTDAEETKKEEEKKEEKDKAPPTPPLEAAGMRLERLLGGGAASTTTSTAKAAAAAEASAASSFYTNPAKIVRRWLTTSSGASGSATLADIGDAAVKLLSPCPEVLSSLKQSSSSSTTEAMDITAEEGTAETKSFLTVAARPFEAWLVSLTVRLLYKAGDYEKAYTICQQGIDVVSAQFEDSRIVSSIVSAFYPLLARLIRWRSLVVEHMPLKVTAALRPQLAQAYNLASLRRDADTQATLLNCMLRDLLHSSQSKVLYRLIERKILRFSPFL